MHKAWLTLGLSMALMYASPVVPGVEAATQLNIVVAAEGPPTKFLPPQGSCSNLPFLFSDQRKSLESYFDTIKKEAKSISQTFFDDDNKIVIDTIQVDLEQVRSELLKENENRIIHTDETDKEYTVGYYLKFLRYVAAQDMHLLKTDNTLGGSTIRRFCNARGTPSVLTRAFWASEFVRKWRIDDYFAVVSWYVRERVKKVPPDRESFVPVVLYPVRSYLVPMEKDGKSLLKSISAILQGGKVSQGSAKEIFDQFSKAAMSTGGQLIRGKEMRDKTFPDYAKRQRLGFWTFYGWDSDSLRYSVQTFTHELGHYLGLAHVFTSDKLNNAKCKKIAADGSFTAAWNESQSEQKVSLCECFFEVKEGKLQFNDYDGKAAGVYDTSLAIYANFIPGQGGNSNNKPIYFSDNCRVSDQYIRYFSKSSQESKRNHMTYYEDPKSLGFSEGQKIRARQMLASFK